MVACVIGPTDGLTRLCSSPRPPPLPLWNVSRAEYIELSRDVHDAYVESSIAQAKSIEPLSSVGNGIDPHRFAKCAQDRTVPNIKEESHHLCPLATH